MDLLSVKESSQISVFGLRTIWSQWMIGNQIYQILLCLTTVQCPKGHTKYVLERIQHINSLVMGLLSLFSISFLLQSGIPLENAKWFLNVQWSMEGVDMHVDVNVGKQLSALGHTLTTLAAFEEEDDDFLERESRLSTEDLPDFAGMDASTRSFSQVRTSVKIK